MAKSRSTPPTSVQKRLAAERAAAARERIQVAQRRRRLTIIASAVGTVLLIVAVLIVVKVVNGDNLKSGKKSVAAGVSVSSALTNTPASVFDEVGAGTSTGAPETPKSTTPLSRTGKPEVLYIGAEYCPFCAAERWPLTLALSRFGSFANLSETSSSPTDVNPNTPTLSYEGSTYTSRYLTFVGKEIYTNQINSAGNGYTTLDKLTSAQAELLKKDANDSFPFVDMNGQFTLNSAQYDGKLLAGLNQKQVAAAISRPSTAISKAIVGSANVLTARLCQLTKDTPASVCSSRGVQTAVKAIAAAKSGGS